MTRETKRKPLKWWQKKKFFKKSINEPLSLITADTQTVGHFLFCKGDDAVNIVRSFLIGLTSTGEVMACILGGALSVIAALLIFGVFAWIICAAFSWFFDRWTRWLADRWVKEQRAPKGKWASVILTAAGKHAAL